MCLCVCSLTIEYAGFVQNDSLDDCVVVVNKADVNARDKEGNTPLHQAKRRGDTEVVQFLIANGAK